MLKIIGIILLVLLGLFLFLLLSILFVPLRYVAKGYYAEDYDVWVKSSWLLHFISMSVRYNKDSDLTIKGKILGFTIYNNKKTKKTSEKKVSEKKISEKETLAGKALEENAENSSDEVLSGSEKCNSSYSEKKDIEIITDTEKTDEDVFSAPKIREKKSTIRTIYSRIKTIISNIRYTIKKICDKIIHIRNNINYYIGLFQQESTKKALRKCKKQLFKVIKSIMPRKFKANLHLGFDDQQTTGHILAIWGELFPIHNGNVIIRPEFDKKVTEGSFYLKGHITGFVLIKAICILFLDKDIKILVKRLKREA